MGIDAIQKYGLEGLQRGIAKATRHSQEIAQFGSTTDEVDTSDPPSPEESYSDSDLLNSIVGLREGELQTYASSKVLKTYDSMTKSVLDLIA
jgi:hypothetical protein